MKNLFTKIQSTETSLKAQKRYFSFYKHFPLIVAVILLGLFFIWGIVDPCVFYYDGYYGYSYHIDAWYGIMELSNGFLCWLIWFIIGIVISICTYLTLRISFSHKLLQIYYLQKIAGEENKILKDNKE